MEPPRQDKKSQGTAAARALAPGLPHTETTPPPRKPASRRAGSRAFHSNAMKILPSIGARFARLAAGSRQSFVQLNSNCTARGSAAFTSWRHHSCLYVGLSNGGYRGQADVGGRRARKRGPVGPDGHVQPARTAGVLARLEDQQDDRIRARVRAVLVVPALMMR